jgi:hypothetical protein
MEPGPVADTLLVFGRGVMAVDGEYRLTADSLARVRTALEYTSRHETRLPGTGPRVVLTGGWSLADEPNTPPVGCREGDLMLRAARLAGGSLPVDLHAETRSRSTLENVLYTVEEGLLGDRAFTAARPLGIVSHLWHLPRVRYLIGKVLGLRGGAVLDIPVVDDGPPLPWSERVLGLGSRLCFLGSTDPASTGVFDAVEDLGGTVLRCSANRGKGAALKTGLRHVAETFPGHDVVSADADGQHSVADIRRVARHVGATGRIVLGVRSFDTDVPLRSRFGNAFTRVLFRAATGHDLRDTQTGLRGYPAALLPWLLRVRGVRFEYEMNVLLSAARDGHPVDEVEVATTYLPGNASSHFGSLTDSVRIYGALLRHAVLSGLG